MKLSALSWPRLPQSMASAWEPSKAVEESVEAKLKNIPADHWGNGYWGDTRWAVNVKACWMRPDCRKTKLKGIHVLHTFAGGDEGWCAWVSKEEWKGANRQCRDGNRFIAKWSVGGDFA
jgi:hypothetical protein